MQVCLYEGSENNEKSFPMCQTYRSVGFFKARFPNQWTNESWTRQNSLSLHIYWVWPLLLSKKLYLNLSLSVGFHLRRKCFLASTFYIWSCGGLQVWSPWFCNVNILSYHWLLVNCIYAHMCGFLPFSTNETALISRKNTSIIILLCYSRDTGLARFDFHWYCEVSKMCPRQDT